MAWVKPTSYTDPYGWWDNEPNAYDGNTGTAANTTWEVQPGDCSSALRFFRSGIWCTKVRFVAKHSVNISNIYVYAYYDGAYQQIYYGDFANQTWVEINLPSLKYIESISFNLHNTGVAEIAYFYEAEYWEVDIPTVTTQAVTDITHNTATGNGNITATGGENATRRGFCYMVGDSGDPTIANSIAYDDGSFGTGAYTKGLTELLPGTTYRVRAYAVNSAGVGYGTTVQFTTDKVSPTVTTQDATEISQNHVKGNGNITASGGENSTERGFQYGLTKTATWTKKETGSYEAGAFYLTIDGLQANTEYWYRAYAKNTIDPFYGYGEWVQFQTAASGTIPLGTKISICSDNSGHTFKLNSSFTDDGETYQSFFVLSTDLAQKQGLHIYKRLEDLYNYFMKKASGTAKIYVKRDSEAEWQYCGQISMVGDEDIIVKHLPSENQDSSGDIDWLAKHFLIKFVFENDFEFIGLIAEAVPIGVT